MQESLQFLPRCMSHTKTPIDSLYRLGHNESMWWKNILDPSQGCQPNQRVVTTPGHLRYGPLIVWFHRHTHPLMLKTINVATQLSNCVRLLSWPLNGITQGLLYHTGDCRHSYNSNIIRFIQSPYWWIFGIFLVNYSSGAILYGSQCLETTII